MQFGFIPTEGGDFSGRRWRGRARGGAGLRLGLDGGAPRLPPHYGRRPGGARGLRRAARAGSAGHRCHRHALLPSGRAAEDVAVIDVLTAGSSSARRSATGRRVRALRPRRRRAAPASWSCPISGRSGPGTAVRSTAFSARRRPDRAEAGAAAHTPIWIGGWGPLRMKRAAHLADAWIPARPRSSEAAGLRAAMTPSSGRPARTRPRCPGR